MLIGTIMFSRRILATVGIAAALVLFRATAGAVTLDWDAVNWTNRFNNSFDIDPASAGNDITVSVTGATAQLGSEPTGELTPALTKNLAGGLSPIQNTLTLFVDFSSQSQTVTVTVDFSALYAQGVESVSFSIFDVDFANENGNGASFQDQLTSVTGTGIDGSLIAPTITTSAANTLTGTGLNQIVNGTATAVDTGTASNAGNVTIDFGTSAIRSFTFTYGGGTNTQNDPTAQHIGLYDITFTPVPEINPAFIALGSCLMAVGLVFHHRSRVRAGRK